MPCPHCGSQSIPFSDVDREYYCMNCGRGKERLDNTPINYHFKKFQTERVICSECKKPFMRRVCLKNKTCAKCKKKEYNATQRTKREQNNRKMGIAGKLKARRI